MCCLKARNYLLVEDVVTKEWELESLDCFSPLYSHRISCNLTLFRIFFLQDVHNCGVFFRRPKISVLRKNKKA